MEMIRLRCQNCMAEMDIDPNKMLFRCPYCHSQSLLVESESVQIQRIKSRTEIEKQKIAKEVDLNKLELEKRKLEQAEREKAMEEASAYRQGIFSKVTIIFAILIILLAIGSYENAKYGDRFLNIMFFCIGTVQAGLFFASWAVGAWVTNRKIRPLSVVFAIIGFVLIPIAAQFIP